LVFFSLALLCVALCGIGVSVFHDKQFLRDLNSYTNCTSMRHITHGEGIPPTQSPISQAVVAGNYCHISGQLAIAADGTFQAGTALEEATLAFQNLFAVLNATGFTKEQVVFVDIAFLDLQDLSAITPLYDGFFEQGRKPARTIYQAAALPMGVKIKVMAVAIQE
jgi:2-iminobutanoate/2-iminopropanoate deaminase